MREQGIWSGRRSKQIDQPTGPTPVPSPIGRGVECEIPPIISELAVSARSEVWRQGEVITKDEGRKRIKQNTLTSILAYEGIPFKAKSV